jgi:hypothetical protein
MAAHCTPFVRDFRLGPLAWGQVTQAPGTDGDPDQAQGRMADGGCHTAYLAIAALADDNFQPSCRDIGAKADRGMTGPQVWLGYLAYLGRLGFAVFQRHTLA